MEHWPEDIPRMGRLPVGYAIKPSKFIFTPVAHDYTFYARLLWGRG